MIIGRYDKEGNLVKIIHNQLDFYIIYYDEYLKYGVDIYSDGFYYVKFEGVDYKKKINVDNSKKKKNVLQAFEICDIRYKIRNLEEASLIYDKSNSQLKDILNYKSSFGKIYLYKKLEKELKKVKKLTLMRLREFNSYFYDNMINVRPSKDNFELRKNYIETGLKYLEMIKQDENLK